VTGATALWGTMGHRRTTPSRVEALLAVASSLHGIQAASWGPGARELPDGRIDHLVSAAEAQHFLRCIQGWYATHGEHRISLELPAQPLTEPDLAGLRRLRDAVHAIALRDRRGYLRMLDDLEARYTFSVDPRDGSLHATTAGWQGFIAELLPPLIALAGLRQRVRFCSYPDCRWVLLVRSSHGRPRCRTHTGIPPRLVPPA
jgi:hypothetical protein